MKEALNSWWSVGLFFVLIAFTQSPVLNPDALEMGLVGQAQLGFMDKGDLALSHYPPLYPVLTALLGVVTGPHVALIALNFICMLGVVFLLQSIVKRVTNPPFLGLWVVFIGFSLAPMRWMTTTADPRALQLFLILLGLFLLRREASSREVWALGFVSGGLVLCRPEGLLFAGLLLVGSWVLWRRVAVKSWGAFALIALPYWTWISLSVGSLSLSSRAWELKGAPLLEILPVRPLIQLWGTGATSTPFREILHDVEVIGSVPRSGVVEAIGASIQALYAGCPLIVLVFAALGACFLWSRQRFLLGMLSSLVAFSMALYLVPMGRDLALPLINLLPGVVAIWALAVCGALACFERLDQRGLSRQLTLGLTLAGILCFAILGLSSEGWRMNLPQAGDSSAQASAWLKNTLAEDERVASSLGSSAIVRRAGRRWERVVSRWERPVLWEGEKAPDYLLFTSVDGDWMLGPPLFEPERVFEPVAYFRDGQGWVMILKI